MLLPALHDVIVITLLSPLMFLMPQFRGVRQGPCPARRALETLRRH